MRRVSPRQGQSRGQGHRDWRAYADLEHLERSELAALRDLGYSSEMAAADAIQKRHVQEQEAKRRGEVPKPHRHERRLARAYGAILTLGHVRMARIALDDSRIDAAAHHALLAGLHAHGGAVTDVDAQRVAAARASGRRAAAAKQNQRSHLPQMQAILDTFTRRNLSQFRAAQLVIGALEDKHNKVVEIAPETIAKMIAGGKLTYP